MISFKPSDYFSLSSQIPLNLYDETKQQDSSFTMIFALEPLESGVKRTLLAKSNYATSKHSFEISELENRSLEVKLFSSPNDYLTFTSLPFSVPTGKHSIVLTFDVDKQKIIAYINSVKHELLKNETGDYTHINEASDLDVTSYVIGEDNKMKYPINANVGTVSIIKEKLSNENLRIISLIMCATMGKNPYLGGQL